jgi:hypothetical protein
MAVVDVLARVRADTSGFTSGIDNAQRALDKFSTSAVTKGTIIGNVLFQAANKAATGFGRLLVGAFRDSISSAQEAQAVQNRLATLLRNTNGATEEQIALLHQQAKALEASTVVSAENVSVVQSQLATFDLHASSIARLTPAILDYVVAERGATASADTFRSYTNGLAQALNGQFGALTRVGFVLDDYDKKMVKTGTENERADAIVRILNTTYKDFAVTAGTTAAGGMAQLSKAINQVKQDFGESLLPTVLRIQKAIGTQLIPFIQNLQQRFGDSKSIERFIAFVEKLGRNLVDFALGIKTLVEPLFTGILVPGIQLVIGAVIQLIEVLGAIGRFIQRNSKLFQFLVIVLASATAAVIAYKAQVIILNAVTKVLAARKILLAAATGKLTLAFKKLNIMMKLNPIGFIIGAVAALTTGFVLLWKQSDHFRNLVIDTAQAALRGFAHMITAIGQVGGAIIDFLTKPIRGFLGILANIPKFGGVFKGVKEFADKVIEGIGPASETAANKLNKLSEGLEKFKKKSKSTYKENEHLAKKGSKVPGLDAFGTAGGGPRVDEKEQKKLAALAEQLRKARLVVKERVEEYNDYLRRDFATSMMKGADSAENAVMRLLDKTRSLFDAQAKLLSGPALDNLEKAWDKVNTKVRKMMGRYASVAGEIEEVQKQIDEAYRELESAIAERQRAVNAFQQVIAQPFGEPSDLDRAFGATTATVDSIISMYDKLKETIVQRYTGIDTAGRDTLLGFLENQTAQLISLSKKRERAVAVLSEVEDELRRVLDEQVDFARDIRSSVRDFATALADLSTADADTTIRVIKKATGLVITQMKESTSGVDKITKQLRDRLNQVVNFNKNIQRLLTRGLDPEYIKQLIQAGPQAASETAQVLASAGDSQIAEINSLYKEINATANSFGVTMARTFYDSAVDMNRAFVTGARAELSEIDAQMLAIKDSIQEKLLPLADFGTDLGMDLAQGLYDSLLAQKDKLVALAQTIAAQISEALASALQGIGVEGTTTLPRPTSSGTTQDLRARTEELKKRTAELRAKIEGRKAATPPTSGTTGGTTSGGGAGGVIPVGSAGTNGGGVTANVTINSSTVAETVTPATIAQALEYTLLTRRAV